MKKISFIIALLFTITLKAQVGMSLPSYSNSNSKWIFGGYAGLNGLIGNGGGMTLHISPRAGYKITQDLIAGVDGTFSWNSSKYVSSTMLGIGPFVDYYFKRTFYASTNLRQYFINSKIKGVNNNHKYSNKETALNIGAGYMRRIGSNTYIQIGATYNVLYDKDKSIFSSPFVPNIGIIFGL